MKIVKQKDFIDSNIYTKAQLFDLFLAGFYSGKFQPDAGDIAKKELFDEYIARVEKLEFVKYLEKEKENDSNNSEATLPDTFST
jgi:hypothetical protein